MKRLRVAPFAFALSMTLCGLAAAQDAPADPAFEAAKQAFEAMPMESRVLIQRSLVWTVPFNGAALGTFGKLTYNGIRAFETKAQLEVDGMLASDELDALVEEAEAAQKAVKFAVQSDKKSGVKIGLPTQLLPKRSETPLGAKWTNADGSVAVEVAKGTGTAADLPDTFDRYLALPGRKVTYKLLRPDFFVVTGENGPNSFYVRYAANETAMRGFTFRYPTAKQKLFDRYVIAAANTFEPFPGQPTDGVVDAPKEPPKPVIRRATAVFSAIGDLTTADSAIRGCKAIRIGGQPATVKVAGGGTATLTGPQGASRLAGRLTPPQVGERVFAVSAGADGKPLLSPGTIIASADGLAISAAIPADGLGAAVIGRDGLLLGIVTGDPSVVKPIAGVTPVARLAIAALIGDSAPEPGSKSAGEIAGAMAAFVVPMECDL